MLSCLITEAGAGKLQHNPTSIYARRFLRVVLSPVLFNIYMKLPGEFIIRIRDEMSSMQMTANSISLSSCSQMTRCLEMVNDLDGEGDSNKLKLNPEDCSGVC